MTERPFESVSNEKAFKKFTTGTPETTTGGKEVTVLSDIYLPQDWNAAKAYFAPEREPLADYVTGAGANTNRKIHHKVFKTQQPRVYYRETELLESDGSVLFSVGSYSRPWNESLFLTDLHERTQKK